MVFKARVKHQNICVFNLRKTKFIAQTLEKGLTLFDRSK